MNSEVHRLFSTYIQRGISQQKRPWCAVAHTPLLCKTGFWILLLTLLRVHAAEPLLKWTSVYEGQYGSSALRATTDSAHDLFVCGNEVAITWYSSTTTLKFSGQDGHLIWRSTFTNNASSTYAGIRTIALDTLGNPIVAGLMRVDSETQSAFVVKYSGSTGQEMWVRRVGDLKEWTTYTSLAILTTNQAALVRYERNGNAILVHGLNLESGEIADPALYKLGTSSLESIQSVIVTSPGELGIAGTLVQPEQTLMPFLLQYVHRSNSWQLHPTFQGLLGAVASQPPRRIALGGSGLSQSSSYAFRVSSYQIVESGLPAYTLWHQDPDGVFQASISSSDILTAIGFDNQDNLLLSGYSTQRGGGSGILTMKVSSTTHVPLWIKLDQDTNYSILHPIRVITDATNDVLVAANAFGGGFKIKNYDGATGEILWSLRNPLPTKTELAEVILDSADNLFVVGNQPNKMFAMKYSPPHPPIATNLQIQVTHVADLVIPLPAYDQDNDPLTVRFLSLPKHGTVTYTNSQLLYHFTNTALVSDSFTLAARDPDLESNPAEVRVEASGPDEDQDGIADTWERGFGRYSIVPGVFSWHEAKDDSEKRGGHLATFSNLSEWNDFKQVLGDSLTGKNLWIGGTDEGDEGRWRWVTPEAWRFTHWRTNEPDNDILGNAQGLTENFVMIWGHEVQNQDGNEAFWNDAPDNGGKLARDGYVLEFGSWSDPSYLDTDFDGLSDLAESFPQLGVAASDPTNPDTDGDGLLDADEVKIYRTDPSRADTDGDGLTDAKEVMLTGTNPLKIDSDGDGLTDWEEFVIYRTSPIQVDTDRDSWSDLEELQHHSDPLSALSIPSARATARPAFGMLIQSEAHQTYLLQSKNDQGDWETFGPILQGTGSPIELLLRTEDIPNSEVRVVISPLNSK